MVSSLPRGWRKAVLGDLTAGDGVPTVALLFFPTWVRSLVDDLLLGVGEVVTAGIRDSVGQYGGNTGS
jgi:hypothetical protein